MSTSNKLKIWSNTTFTTYFQHTSYNRILAHTTIDSVFRIPESGSPASHIPSFWQSLKSRWRVFEQVVVDIDRLSVIVSDCQWLSVLWEWFCSFWLQHFSKTSNVRWKADTFNSAMFQDVSISLPRQEVTPQRTRRNWSSKSGLKHLRDVYVAFIRYLLSLLGLASPASWTDRSFELTLLLLVFTQAFHKISIQTSINNTENMPQVTLSNNSAISIDNEACFLCYLWTFGWIFYGTLE